MQPLPGPLHRILIIHLRRIQLTSSGVQIAQLAEQFTRDQAALPIF